MKKKYVKIIVLCVVVVIGMAALLFLLGNQDKQSSTKKTDTGYKYAKAIGEKDTLAMRKAENIAKDTQEHRKISDANNKIIKDATDFICTKFSDLQNLSADEQIELQYNAAMLFYMDDLITNAPKQTESIMTLKDTKWYILAQKLNRFMPDYTDDLDAPATKDKEKDFSKRIESIQNMLDGINSDKKTALKEYIHALEINFIK